MKSALLIIDMLNEYLDPSGKIYCEAGRDIIDNIARLKAHFKHSGNPVIYVNTSHINSGDPETAKWGLHAMRGTWGADVIPELKPEDDDCVVLKRTYDGFYNTELEITLKSFGVDTVVVTGIHTHVCVMCTALGACYRGFNVIALEECMTTGYKPNHESRLRFYNSHIGKLMKLDDYINENTTSDEE